jgi:hypothetical protein
MNLNFSPVRFGSGDPERAQAAMRRQISNDDIKADNELSRDIFTHGGLHDMNNEKRSPKAIKSTQVSQTLRNIINKNKERDLGT